MFRPFVTLSLLFCSLFSHAQSKQKAEQEFLQQLNSIIQHSPRHHWSYEGKMTIDSAFAISKKGILSVSLHYTTDSSVIRVRIEAPLRKLVTVSLDDFLILETKGKDVSFYLSENGSNVLLGNGKGSLFHIGIPENDGENKRDKLSRALANVLKFYK